MKQVASSASRTGLARLDQSILRFCGQAPGPDDNTLLLVRRIGSNLRVFRPSLATEIA